MGLKDSTRKLELFWLLMGRTAYVLSGMLLLAFLSALYWQENALLTFLLPALMSLLLGEVMRHASSKQHMRHWTTREGVLFIVSVWLFVGIVGALPYVFSGILPNFIAAFFEAISALTTTGSTCLHFDASDLPRSLIFWHSLLCWFGAWNFVVILVTVLPQVSGCFGLTLTARQSLNFSPVWNRMRQSVRQVTAVYSLVTALAAIAFYITGLNFFDALSQAMMTVSASGATSAYTYIIDDDWALELASGFAMLLSGISLLLCWKVWNRRNLKMLFQDTELRAYLYLLLVAGALISLHLFHWGLYDGGNSLRYGFFQAVSFLTTNGLVSAPIWNWPSFDRYCLFLLAFVGGCIGSVTGGLKVMRLLVLFRLAWAEMRRTLHPHMVVVIKMDNLPVPVKITGRILTYFFLYLSVFAFFSLLFSLSGVSLMQAMSIAAGCLTSTGGLMLLFDVHSLYFLPAWGKLAASLLMVIGRVEIFSFLILLDMAADSFHRRW